MTKLFSYLLTVRTSHASVYRTLAEIISTSHASVEFILAPSVCLLPRLKAPAYLRSILNIFSQLISSVLHLCLVLSSKSTFIVLSEYYSLFLPVLLMPCFFYRNRLILNVNHNLCHENRFIRCLLILLHWLAIRSKYRFLFLDYDLSSVAKRCGVKLVDLNRCIFLPFPYYLVFDSHQAKLASSSSAIKMLSSSYLNSNEMPVFSIVLGRNEQIDHEIIEIVISTFYSSNLSSVYKLVLLCTRYFCFNALSERLKKLFTRYSLEFVSIEGSQTYYLALTASAFILLPYDIRQYELRHSGILTESLSHGVQVIVPFTTTFEAQSNGLAYLYKDKRDLLLILQRLRYPSNEDISYCSWYRDLTSSVKSRNSSYIKLKDKLKNVGQQ